MHRARVAGYNHEVAAFGGAVSLEKTRSKAARRQAVVVHFHGGRRAGALVVQIRQHAVGTFCFMESGSASLQLSRRFYGRLLGWGADVHAFADGGSYTRFLVRGLPVAGAFSVDANHDLARLPTHWWPFVSVADISAVMEQATSLGATPLGDVVDVAGEFAAAEFRDPSGAVCGLWQARAHIGARLTGEAGALSWTDLSTPDPSAAAAFYGELFGWAREPNGADTGSYEFVSLDGVVVTAFSRSDSAAAWWRPHVGVNDFDAALALAAEFGRDVTTDAHVPSLGRRAMVTDPNGIRLMLIEPMT